MHQAERNFRKKIAACFAGQPPAQRPVSVYLLDVIELEDISRPVLMNYSAVREDDTPGEPASEDEPAGKVHQMPANEPSETTSGSVYFSGLPLREPNARHWSVSMPQDPERFMLID